MNEYWFARRFPIGHSRNAMAPVHWKGWAMFIVFGLMMAGGGSLFLWLANTDRMALGIGAFVLIAFVATTWLLLLVRANGDNVNTVADYQKGKLRV